MKTPKPTTPRTSCASIADDASPGERRATFGKRQHAEVARLSPRGASFAIGALLTLTVTIAHASSTKPLAQPDLVFAETDGVVAIEAEHFIKQEKTDVRAWHLVTTQAVPEVAPDGDESHAATASGGAYLEVLPDTRRTADDKLIKGENITHVPGQLAVLTYAVHFTAPGRYYVWVRAYSTGAEDNGVHIGLDGAWPESGQRWQTTVKNRWHWDCRQRTNEVHEGVPLQLFLDVANAGQHLVHVGMREDGFEFDKLVLTRDRDFVPTDTGPPPRVHRGALPSVFPAHTVVAAAAAPASAGSTTPAPTNGNGAVTISGELKQWHKVTLDLAGPFARERDTAPNPFTDHRMTVTFTHESGSPVHRVPGYFAADGRAAESGAEAGTVWRAHLSPDKPGRWNYVVSFVRGPQVALSIDARGSAVAPFDRKRGSFVVAPSDKTGRDFRAHGRLQYVGQHHLRFAGSGEYFLKAGPDAPETLLAFVDFDGTTGGRPNAPLKTWAPHVRDWQPGDPVWRGEKGKGLIGALNYLASKGINAFSFLTYNAGGDGDNVWPFVARDAKLHYDCSKLDQWGIVFDHAQALGLYLHFKLQETEIDDQRGGPAHAPLNVPEALDGGALGPERRLYLRELVARFGHALALNWNLGEENTQSADEVRAMAQYLADVDPYGHHRVLHTYPTDQDRVYFPLLGAHSRLTGASLQNDWDRVHQRTLLWLRASAAAGAPWVCANDEQGSANTGVPPDPGYEGFSGAAEMGGRSYDLHDIRKLTLWGNLMAGGAGVEYYFGYRLPQNDLAAEDFRSRDQSWDYCRIALDFFREHRIPFWSMSSADVLVGNAAEENTRYGFAQPGELYLVYLPNGGTAELQLAGTSGSFSVQWFNPRTGGALTPGSVAEISSGIRAALGNPPADETQDWLIVVRRK